MREVIQRKRKKDFKYSLAVFIVLRNRGLLENTKKGPYSGIQNHRKHFFVETVGIYSHSGFHFLA